MYKLLLVSDQEEVLNAFSRIQNWELQGFKPPHIRHDFEGAKDSLSKHHADGICIAVNPEEEEKILSYLQTAYPKLSIFEAGRTEEQVLRYLNELKILLNRLHADFYNETVNSSDVLMLCRHEFFRKLINGRIRTGEDLRRNMRLLRSRMDADRPCLLIELGQSDPHAQLDEKWQYNRDRLEIVLRTRLLLIQFFNSHCTGRRSRATSVWLETDIQAPKTCVLPLHYARMLFLFHNILP